MPILALTLTATAQATLVPLSMVQVRTTPLMAQLVV
jgi:hypothetical protein